MFARNDATPALINWQNESVPGAISAAKEQGNATSIPSSDENNFIFEVEVVCKLR